MERNVISLTGLLCKRGVFTFIFPPYSRKAFLQKELHFRTGEGHLVLLGFSGCPLPWGAIAGSLWEAEKQSCRSGRPLPHRRWCAVGGRVCPCTARA